VAALPFCSTSLVSTKDSEERAPGAQGRFFRERDQRGAVDALSGVTSASSRIVGAMSTVRDELAASGVRFDPRAADDQRQMGRGP